MENLSEESKMDKSKKSEEFLKWVNKRRKNARMPNQVYVSVVNHKKPGCTQGYKIGDTWIIEPHKTPSPPMCAQVYEVLRQAIVTMGFGGEFPWDDKDVTWFSCPDPKFQQIYEIRRLEEKVTPPKNFDKREVVE